MDSDQDGSPRDHETGYQADYSPHHTSGPG